MAKVKLSVCWKDSWESNLYWSRISRVGKLYIALELERGLRALHAAAIIYIAYLVPARAVGRLGMRRESDAVYACACHNICSHRHAQRISNVVYACACHNIRSLVIGMRRESAMQSTHAHAIIRSHNLTPPPPILQS